MKKSRKILFPEGRRAKKKNRRCRIVNTAATGMRLKAAALVLALLMIFSACGSQEQPEESSSQGASQSQTQPSSQEKSETEDEKGDSSSSEPALEEKPQPVTGIEESSSPQQSAPEDQWVEGDPEGARAQVEGWEKVAAAFYQGTSFCPKEEISYDKAEGEISGVFNLYETPGYDQDDLFSLEGGETVRQRLQLNTEEFGVLLRLDGVLRAEGFVSQTVDKSGNLLEWAIQSINGLTEGQASGAGGRESLKMTPELMAALEEAGMNPETTEAFYVQVEEGSYAHRRGPSCGLLFVDGTVERFLATDSTKLTVGKLYTPAEAAEEMAEIFAFEEGRNPPTG